MLFLDAPNDAYPVGATTFTVPIRPSRVVGKARLNNEPALRLDEVAFTAYYPARTDGTERQTIGIHWLLRPVKESLRGLAHFGRIPAWLIWPVVYLLGAFVKVPVYANAPLLEPPLCDRRQWPLVIFSHGLGGSRTAYSQLCTRLAASGSVVLALEHRDGTGHVCMPRSKNTDGQLVAQPKMYIRENDISWEPGDEPQNQTLPFRSEQLAFRKHEIYTAYAAFWQMTSNGNTHHTLQTIDGCTVDWTSWGPARVQVGSDVTLMGHSFGGCTVLSLLSTGPLLDHPLLPVTKALVLDPWLEPLPLPGPSPHAASTLVATTMDGSKEIEDSAGLVDLNNTHKPDRPQLLVINSERFTLWEDHFARLKGIVDEWEPQGKRLITIVRSQHQSFSDFPVLPLLRTKTARHIIQLISKLSVSFIDGKLEDALKTVHTRKMEVNIIGVKSDGKPKRQLIGASGDIVIH